MAACGFLFVLLSSFLFWGVAEAKVEASRSVRPRLTVLLIVDQMRADLLTRFAPALRKSAQGTDEGMLRLRTQGVEFINARTASAPSVTAAGHATVCTGASARKHGIVGNSFFDSSSRKEMESTFDPSVKPVVSESLQQSDPLSRVQSSGSSARLRKVASLADVVAQLSAGKARTVSLSLKDRGAVFCSGQSSVGTYWYDYKTGSMVSSTAFTKALPEWVNSFNTRALAERKVEWKAKFSVSEMQNFLSDPALRSALTVRSPLSKNFGSGFPYVLSSTEAHGLAGRKFFEYTPSANDYLADFALEAVRAERLGCASRDKSAPCAAGEFPDVLTISFSTPDLVGHAFGGESAELMDIYINLNKTVERLMKNLESQFGAENIVFVLSADHGVQTLPEVLQSRGQTVNRLSVESVAAVVESGLGKKFGSGPWVETIITSELYFKKETLQRSKFSKSEIERAAREILTGIAGIRDVIGDAELKSAKTSEVRLYAKGHDPERSGDLKILTQAGWLWGTYNAANHGTAFDEDTRIPLIFSGWKIKSGGRSSTEAFADDLAPTLLGLLGERVPPSMTGRSLASELLPSVR